MELSTIIGIVVAIIFIVIALKMIFSKSADPSAEDQSLHIHPETNLPVVPRHLRVAQTEQNVAINEKIEPKLSEAALADVEDTKQPVITPIATESVVETETKPVSSDVTADIDAKTTTDLNDDKLVVQATAAHSDREKAESIANQTKADDEPKSVQALTATDSTDATLSPTKPAVAISTEALEDWEGESSILDLHLTEQERHDEESALACAEHIVALYVWPNPSRALSGEKTLKILLKYGLRYGEMQCFHRYQQVEETSPLMFSVLRLTDEGPAGFDLESLSTEQVNGLAFFLALPNAHAGLGFDSMASIANHIAKDVDGKVFDENGQELTAQLREHWRHQVIEFRSGQEMTAAG